MVLIERRQPPMISGFQERQAVRRGNEEERVRFRLYSVGKLRLDSGPAAPEQLGEEGSFRFPADCCPHSQDRDEHLPNSPLPGEKGQVNMTLTRLLAALAIMTISAAASAEAGGSRLTSTWPSTATIEPGHGANAPPSATMTRARDLLRPRIAAGLEADVLVLIRGGTYRLERPLVFGPDDSGTDRHTITYAAWPGEKVMLSERRKISGWRRGCRPDLDRGTSLGQSRPVVLPPVVFVGDRRPVRPRTPNGPEWWEAQASEQ